MSRFFGLSLLPFFVSDAGHDLHVFFGLLLFIFNAFLLMILDLLLISLSLLLHQALLQPVLEGLVTFLLLDLLCKALGFLFSEHLLLFEGLTDEFLLLPLVHAMSSLLVVLIKGSLLHDHLFKEVLFGLKDQDFAQALLMFLDSEPGIVRDLGLSNCIFTVTMHLEDRLVNLTHLGFISRVLEVNVLAFFAALISINLSLSCLIQPLE